MEDVGDFETVETYLHHTEIDSVKSQLTAMDIDFVVNGHGTKGRYSSLYFEVRVKKSDWEAASRIIKKRKAISLAESRCCPKCKNPDYDIIEKRGFWQKLYYLGTILVQCKKCREKYPL